jgi:hypothetical protein
MAIYSLNGVEPSIHPDAFIHPDAVVIGDVTIGAFSTVWPGAVLRGDHGSITIGDRTSIQDGTVVHTVPSSPTSVGSGCIVGHVAHLEGCIIHDNALVGSGSVVLHRAHVGEWSIVGANAVITNDTIVPDNALALGIPAKIKEGMDNRAHIEDGAAWYVENGKRYRETLKRLL